MNKDEIIIPEVIQTDITKYELDWLLNYDLKETPKEYSKYITNKNNNDLKNYQFLIKDIYKFLNRDEQDIRYSVNKENYFLFNILMTPEFLLIKNLVKYNDTECRILANVMASYISSEIDKILKQISKINNDLKKNTNSSNKNDIQCANNLHSNNSLSNSNSSNAMTGNNIDNNINENNATNGCSENDQNCNSSAINNSNGNSHSDNDTDKFSKNITNDDVINDNLDIIKNKIKDIHKNIDNSANNDNNLTDNDINKFITDKDRNTDKLIEKLVEDKIINNNLNLIKDKLDVVYKNVSSRAGKSDGIISFADDIRYKKINLNKDRLNTIKNIGNKLYDFYFTEDSVTQTTSQIPRTIDYSMINELLWLEKIANSGFVNIEHTSKLYIDVYFDISQSMDGIKFEFAKGVIVELLNKKIKFKNIYVFENKITQLNNVNELLKIKVSGGGTDITKVLDSISKSNKKALIISDLEDDIDIDLIKKNAEKISIILIGNKDYYDKYWKNYCALSFYVDGE